MRENEDDLVFTTITDSSIIHLLPLLLLIITVLYIHMSFRLGQFNSTGGITVLAVSTHIKGFLALEISSLSLLSSLFSSSSFIKLLTLHIHSGCSCFSRERLEGKLEGRGSLFYAGDLPRILRLCSGLFGNIPTRTSCCVLAIKLIQIR